MTDKVEFSAAIVVDVERDGGLWFATSRMMLGLMIAGHSREECVEKIPGALADFATICRDTDAPAKRPSGP